MLGLASILLLGIGAQWLAWRLRLPSILLLLLVGFVVGPFTGHKLLDPDELLGESLLPFVSLAVAVILFEGGLTLRFRALKEARGAVRNLIVLGSPLTWGLSAVAARWTLGVDWGGALLVGAILVVTGPTVIIPLLRHVRPSGTVGATLRWEGIVTDPIGAILAVLVFQALIAGGLEEGRMAALIALGKALAAGGIGGSLGAGLLIVLLRRNLIPDFLHSAVTLAFVLAIFVGSNQVQHESGLLAVTLMGILMANQRSVSVEHILEFKENLGVLLISTLFILLAARLPLEVFTRFDLRMLAFVVVLIIFVRPVMVYISTLGTRLSWAERTFAAWMAPRGIVAAAVASVFALEMEAAGIQGAERMVPVVFLVIILTVAFYGLTSGPLARRLGLSRGAPQGVLFLGSHEWARELAKTLVEADVEVLMVDTNHHDVQAARLEGLPAYYGSVLSEEFELTAPLEAIGNVLAMTHNDEVNALACLQLAPTVGRAHTFQVQGHDDDGGEEERPLHLRGRYLFDEGVRYWDVEARFRNGAIVKRTRLGEEFGLREFIEHYQQDGAPVVPLFLVREDGRVQPFTKKGNLEPQVGDTLIALVAPDDEDNQATARDEDDPVAAGAEANAAPQLPG